MIGWWLVGCAARSAVVVGPAVETSGQFLLHAMGRDIAGTAVVTVDDDGWSLLGLGPTGTAWFGVHSEHGAVDVRAPDDKMAQVLERLPLERDLWLLYRWQCPARCRTGSGTIRMEDERMSFRGRGGPATVERTPGRATLVDPRRGYTLTVLIP